MGTQSLRIRLVFEDRSILSKTQRSDGMNHSWFLLKLQQYRSISDVCTHLLNIFKLHSSCPNGILLSMDGFALPPFESTEILKDKEVICVKKKGGATLKAADGGNLLDEVENVELEPGNNGLLLLANDKFDNENDESEEEDEEQSQDEESPGEIVIKKRKASMKLQNSKKKKRCLGVLDDDEDEAEMEEIENVVTKPNEATNKNVVTTNKKLKSPSIVKRGELQENVEEVNQVTTAPGDKKMPSRCARRKKAKRQWMQELAKIAKKKPQPYSKPEVTKAENKEANGQPKGLINWKQASKKPVQNGDVGPVVTRPVHIRFEPLDEDQAVKQTAASNVQILVPEYPIVSDNMAEDGPNESLHGEDVTLEINYDSDAIKAVSNGVNRTAPSYDKDAAKNLESNSNGNNIDVPKDSNPGDGEVNPWDLLSKVNPTVNHSSMVGSGLNPCSYRVAGPSTSTAPDANKPESSTDQDGQNGNSSDPWLNANKPKSQENDLRNPSSLTGWTDTNKVGPTENNCETGCSWGRPWSSFVDVRGSLVKQGIKENERYGGSFSRGGGKPWSRGAPRGQGQGRGRGRGRGRGQGAKW